MNPANKQLTERQEDILSYIKESVEIRGFPPTFREIADHFNIGSTNAVSGHIMALENKGYIKTLHSKARAITVL